MNAPSKKRFLIISNIVISVLAAASIICCFLIPLWRVDFSVTFTDEMGNALKSIVYVNENGGAATVSAADGRIAKTSLSDVLPDTLKSSGKEIFDSFVDALCEAKLGFYVSESFSSADMLGALYDMNPNRAAGIIDRAVDGFIADAERIIADFLTTAVKVAAKEVVKITVDGMLKENYEDENYDKFIEEIGTDRERIESLIDRIIDSIMADGSTVDSVTATVLESADEAQKILAGTDKFSESAQWYDEDAKAAVKESTESLLKTFADEDGKLNFKETLIRMLLNSANQALESFQNGGYDGTMSVFGMAVKESEPEPTAAESADKLKTQIKSIAFNFGDGAAAKFIVGIMAVIGALLEVLLFMLFYPILRTLTKIGADDPGFNMFLPVFGGISSFTLLVILPSFVPGVLKLISAGGEVFSVPSEIITVINAVTLKFSSCTVVAFVFAAALFVFSFFYGHQRKALSKNRS